MNLVEYLTSLGNIAIALSGGVDSSYLAYAVKESHILLSPSLCHSLN